MMAAVRAAEQNFHVDLVSIVPVRRSHSVCAQGGINAAVNTEAFSELDTDAGPPVASCTCSSSRRVWIWAGVIVSQPNDISASSGTDCACRRFSRLVTTPRLDLEQPQ